jgi:non-ribosomal peptide synthetase component F
MAADPQQRLSEISILSAEERQQLLTGWNDTAREYANRHCVHELFEAQAERTPERVALTFEGTQLTYRELNSRANQLARHLQTLGVGPEVLVGLCLERSPEMVVGLLAVLKAGGAYVPLDPSYPLERLAFIIEDAGATVMLIEERVAESIPATDRLHRLGLGADCPTERSEPARRGGAGECRLRHLHVRLDGQAEGCGATTPRRVQPVDGGGVRL